MKADEAADMMDREHDSDRFKQRAAVVIAVLAMLLAITGLGGGNAAKDAVNGNIAASNLYAFYQAKNARQTSLIVAADQIELTALNDPSLPDAAKEVLRAKLAQYRATIQRYETEPATGEGKKELLERALVQEKSRDHALRQDPYFDYGEALLQIAIVLISVSIVANIGWLALVGAAVGAVGTLSTLNGFFLFVSIPGLG